MKENETNKKSPKEHNNLAGTDGVDRAIQPDNSVGIDGVD